MRREAFQANFLDSLTLCSFLRNHVQEIFARSICKGHALRSLRWEVSQDEWLDMIRRGAYMERCYCIREGYVPTRDDVLPDRFFEETIYNKYGTQRS